MNKILVVGGAGYIGSHMVKYLLKHGYEVITLDNLENGYRDAVLGGEFVQGDLADIEFLDDVFKDNPVNAVMHFASYIQVGESVSNPSKYYNNNFANTLNLLDVMVKYDVRNFVFSSTAAIFGEPEYIPIDENHPKLPINPYGKSKLMVEMALDDYDQAYGLKSICLRYFNAAGADPEGELGERHDPETHLIPLTVQAALGQRDSIKVFGNDYDTKDGTCIRDYIHVNDLCDAHIKALETLLAGGDSARYNLGNGMGYSVKEIIESVRKVSGREFNEEIVGRRDGDPEQLISDSRLAADELGWNPEFIDLDTIVLHTLTWEKKQCK